jgi:hypothetical protein
VGARAIDMFNTLDDLIVAVVDIATEILSWLWDWCNQKDDDKKS